MNVDILFKTDNKVLERKEVSAEVSYEGATPKRKDLKQAVCSKVGASPDLSVLRDVNPTYGKQAVKVTVHSYGKKETMMSTEPAHILKRDGLAEEEKKEEAPKEEKPAEAAKEEKPKEAPKEEKPAEAPKKEEKPAEKKEEKPKEAPKEEKPKEEKKAEEKPAEKKE